LAGVFGAGIGVVAVQFGATTANRVAAVVLTTIAIGTIARETGLAQTAGFASGSLGLTYRALAEERGLAILTAGTRTLARKISCANSPTGTHGYVSAHIASALSVADFGLSQRVIGTRLRRTLGTRLRVARRATQGGTSVGLAIVETVTIERVGSRRTVLILAVQRGRKFEAVAAGCTALHLVCFEFTFEIQGAGVI
jgi:hypothetical protein